MSQDGGYIALKGFCYQFDKTIIEIFSQSSDIQVEQLQDLGFDDYQIQVKHHDTDYNAAQQKAKKKTPILGLLEQFQKDPGQQFVLYIYLKGIAPSTNVLDVAALDEILGKEAHSIDMKIREAFVKKFTLVQAPDFYAQHTEVIHYITTAYGKSKDEAEIYYTLISAHLLQLVVNNPAPNITLRKTSRKDINNLIKGTKELIFKSQYAEILGVDKYNSALRKLYFKSGINTEAIERFFIIETPVGYTVADAKELVLHIKSRWSKNKLRATPDNERYAPYIYFLGWDNISLTALKKQLSNEGIKVKDGHEYRDADFDVHSLMEKPTMDNKIQFRLLNDERSLLETIAQSSKTKEFYQFYTTTPISIPATNTKHLQIQINNPQQIINIV